MEKKDINLEKEKIIKRLKRIEGQIKGLQKMIEEDRDCEDILTQLLAIEKAIDKLSIVMVESYLKHCLLKENVVDTNKVEKLEQFLKLLHRLK